MLFNSIHFLFFFAIVMVMYFAVSYRFRWVLLLIASYFFYMSLKPVYIVLITILTLVSYYAGLQMGKTEIKSKKKKFLILAALANIGFLFLYKYYDFFNHSFKAIFYHYHLSYEIPALHFILPIGISFYTFKGLKLMLWGLFQKMVIADNLAPLVDSVYNDPTHHQGVSLILATLFFAFQIYCDFSGYSDIAIGAAQVMGFTTMENFNRPYFSKSIPEFWRRWHISLSTWFRDYLYIPMGGNRVSLSGWYFNLFIVLLICGFWHGANWTFLVWGGLHGIYLVFSAFTQNIREKIHKAIGLDRVPRFHSYLRVIVTFFLVCFAWIFFRANTISDAVYIISNLFAGWGRALPVEALENLPFWGPLKFEFIVSLLSIV